MKSKINMWDWIKTVFLKNTTCPHFSCDKNKLRTTSHTLFMAKFMVIYLNKSYDTQRENIYLVYYHTEIKHLKVILSTTLV